MPLPTTTYTVPDIDPDSGIDSHDGSGSVELYVWDEFYLEEALVERRQDRDNYLARPADQFDEEILANIVDDLLWTQNVLSRFTEERWAVLYGCDGWSQIPVMLTADV